MVDHIIESFQITRELWVDEGDCSRGTHSVYLTLERGHLLIPTSSDNQCDARDLEWAAKNSEVIKDGRGPVDADGIDVDEPAKVRHIYISLILSSAYDADRVILFAQIKDDEEESVLDKILAGTFSIVSDKTLGGSAAEARREQEILEVRICSSYRTRRRH